MTKYRHVLIYLHGAIAAVLEANEEGIECRADEDCDHCGLLQAMACAESLLAENLDEKETE